MNIDIKDLKKNKNITLRINEDIKKTLENNGHKMQMIFDKAINELLNIEIKENK